MVYPKQSFKCTSTEDLDLDEGHWDIHVISGALKLFFRELQEPLFPYSHFNSFVQGISEYPSCHNYGRRETGGVNNVYREVNMFCVLI